MAAIRPFRAWRYDPARAGAPERLLAPLDDEGLISRLHYRISEHALHLAAPRSAVQAADRWRRWRVQGMLRQDPLPAVYPYSQTFFRPSHSEPYERLGVLLMLRLDGPGEPRCILPHEGTLEASVASLTQQQIATGLNVSPIHVLYEGLQRSLTQLLSDALADPLTEVTDGQGVTHRMGMIQHCEQLQQIELAFAGAKLIVADGHHRLAAAMRCRDHLIATQGPLPAHHLANYVLAYCTDGDAGSPDAELPILPFHRAVQLPSGIDASALLARLHTEFSIEPIESRAVLPQLLAAEPHRIGLVVARKWYLLTLRSAARIAPLLNHLSLPDSVRELDYTLLHGYVFDRLLGIPYAEQRTSAHISYHPDAAAAIDKALYQPNHAAFLMHGLTIGQLRRVVHDHALMPPKSTYFTPKVLAGLVFADLRDDLSDTPYDR